MEFEKYIVLDGPLIVVKISKRQDKSKLTSGQISKTHFKTNQSKLHDKFRKQIPGQIKPHFRTHFENTLQDKSKQTSGQLEALELSNELVFGVIRRDHFL